MLERAADGIDSDRAQCENPLMSYAIVRAEIERFLDHRLLRCSASLVGGG